MAHQSSLRVSRNLIHRARVVHPASLPDFGAIDCVQDCLNSKGFEAVLYVQSADSQLCADVPKLNQLSQMSASDFSFVLNAQSQSIGFVKESVQLRHVATTSTLNFFFNNNEILCGW